MADPPRYPDSNSDIGDYPGTPRWVKVFGIIVIVLILLFVILQVTGVMGDHGPGRHLSFGEAAAYPQWAMGKKGSGPC